jgi:hypothetical protein
MARKTVEKELELEKTRLEIFEDSKFAIDNKKYGLFSYPGTLPISKNPPNPN